MQVLRWKYPTLWLAKRNVSEKTVGKTLRTDLARGKLTLPILFLLEAATDAQKQKLNPDLWNDVKKVLPLLALPEYYEGTKYGYTRGGMPVAFVDRVRAYYDILLRQEPAYQPRLRAFPFAMSP